MSVIVVAVAIAARRFRLRLFDMTQQEVRRAWTQAYLEGR